MATMMAETEIFDFAPAASSPWGVDQTPCPVCGEPEIDDYRSVEFAGGGLVFQGARCQTCGARWSEDYYLQTACIESVNEMENRFVVAAGSLLDRALDVLAVHDGGGAEIKALLDACQTALGAGALFAELDVRAKRLMGVA